MLALLLISPLFAQDLSAYLVGDWRSFESPSSPDLFLGIQDDGTFSATLEQSGNAPSLLIRGEWQSKPTDDLLLTVESVDGVHVTAPVTATFQIMRTQLRLLDHSLPADLPDALILKHISPEPTIVTEPELRVNTSQTGFAWLWQLLAQLARSYRDTQQVTPAARTSEDPANSEESAEAYRFVPFNDPYILQNTPVQTLTLASEHVARLQLRSADGETVTEHGYWWYRTPSSVAVTLLGTLDNEYDEPQVLSLAISQERMLQGIDYDGERFGMVLVMEPAMERDLEDAFFAPPPVIVTEAGDCDLDPAAGSLHAATQARNPGTYAFYLLPRDLQGQGMSRSLVLSRSCTASLVITGDYFAVDSGTWEANWELGSLTLYLDFFFPSEERYDPPHRIQFNVQPDGSIVAKEYDEELYGPDLVLEIP